MPKKILVFTFCFFMMVCCFGKQQTLNIYAWANYIPYDVIQLFEKKTGIRVNVGTFDNNQVLYSKLKADSNAGYDIVIPSAYIVDRLRKENMLISLDKSKISGVKNINDAFLNHSFDPENQYSIPYLWGTSGIIINTKKYDPKQFQTWQSLWNSSLKDSIGLPDDMRDSFAMAFMALGYSINDSNLNHLDVAYKKLKSLEPNVKAYVANGSIQEYLSHDMDVGVVAYGDAQKIMRQNSDFQFILPNEGVKIWVDSMTIPKNAPHLENAYQFINFVLQSDIAEMIANETGFLSPLKSMKEFHGEFEMAVSNETDRQMLKYWEMLKS